MIISLSSVRVRGVGSCCGRGCGVFCACGHILFHAVQIHDSQTGLRYLQVQVIIGLLELVNRPLPLGSVTVPREGHYLAIGTFKFKNLHIKTLQINIKKQ